MLLIILLSNNGVFFIRFSSQCLGFLGTDRSAWRWGPLGRLWRGLAPATRRYCTNENCCLKNMGVIYISRTSQTSFYIMSYPTISRSVRFVFQIPLNGLASRYTYKVYMIPNTRISAVKHQLRAITSTFEASQNEHRSEPGLSGRPRNPGNDDSKKQND